MKAKEEMKMTSEGNRMKRQIENVAAARRNIK